MVVAVAYQVRRPSPHRESIISSGKPSVTGLYHSRRSKQLKLMSGVGRTSPQPLHGYAASSCSMGDSGYPVGESIIKAMTMAAVT